LGAVSGGRSTFWSSEDPKRRAGSEIRAELDVLVVEREQNVENVPDSRSRSTFCSPEEQNVDRPLETGWMSTFCSLPPSRYRHPDPPPYPAAVRPAARGTPAAATA
jgi:hypothetical protein